MSISLKNRSLISISDYTPEEICHVLDIAEDFEKNPHQNLLNGRIIASLFFEPSTRTRLSFETAIQLLGGNVIGFSSTAGTSIQKGESLADTITMVASYADLIVMRNPIEGSARFASEVSKVPVINAGDGANQHPTQCMLDLYSIRKTQGTLENQAGFGRNPKTVGGCVKGKPQKPRAFEFPVCKACIETSPILSKTDR